MAIGFKRRSNGDEYVFIDGVAMRAEEAVRIQVDTPDPVPQQPMEEPKSLPELMVDDKRKMRVRYGIFTAVLVALFVASLCLSEEYYATFYDPASIAQCALRLPKLIVLAIIDPAGYTLEHQAVVQALPMYDDFVARLLANIKYIIAGIMLAVSGMLYQSSFRNPIAAPSMLGVSNGISLAMVIMVIMFGNAALTMVGQYYLYSFIGGLAILVLVLLGGYLTSAKGELNTVNMLLIGTMASQLLGVIIGYLQNTCLTDTDWSTFYRMQAAVNLDSVWTFATLIGGFVVSMIPVMILRFRLNLISFSDAETKLLGVNPTALRVVALVCGSLMILVAQINVGQVAMGSLVLPFVSRAVFGSEFRKQLLGNVLLGAVLILFCGDFISLIVINGVPLDLGTVVTVIALPLFVWMLMIRQRNWGE